MAAGAPYSCRYQPWLCVAMIVAPPKPLHQLARLTKNPRVYRVLVLGADASTIEHIRSALQHEGDVQIVRELSNAETARTLLPHLDPDVVILDADVAGSDAPALMAAVGRSGEVGLIVISSVEILARHAYDARALDFILKPFATERLISAVERVRIWIVGLDLAGELEPAVVASPPSSDRAPVTRLAIRQNERVVFIRIEDVDYFAGSGNHVNVHVGETTHRMRASLRELSRRLESHQFRRIHRSTLVNMSRITEVQRWFGGDYLALLTSGKQLRVSRTYASALLQALQ